MCASRCRAASESTLSCRFWRARVSGSRPGLVMMSEISRAGKICVPSGSPASSSSSSTATQEKVSVYFFPDRVGELVKVFASISDELHNHYALAYTPTRPPDGTWREIAVKLNRKDAELRVRKGYFAVKRARTPHAADADAPKPPSEQ